MVVSILQRISPLLALLRSASRSALSPDSGGLRTTIAQSEIYRV